MASVEGPRSCLVGVQAPAPRRRCIEVYTKGSSRAQFQLLQERLEFAFELSSTIGADGADLDACGGSVFHDKFAKLFRGVAFMIEEAN